MNAAKVERTFFDTNLLVYSDDSRDLIKNRRARTLISEHLRTGSGVVSMQILQEYYAAVTRKFKTPLDPSIARRKIEILCAFEVVSLRPADLLAAIDLGQRYGFSFWDSLVIRAALQARCTVLLTEDLQHNQFVEGLRIVNPFL
jgi:predicted nucleic acid-binding protein